MLYLIIIILLFLPTAAAVFIIIKIFRIVEKKYGQSKQKAGIILFILAFLFLFIAYYFGSWGFGRILGVPSDEYVVAFRDFNFYGIAIVSTICFFFSLKSFYQYNKKNIFLPLILCVILVGLATYDILIGPSVPRGVPKAIAQKFVETYPELSHAERRHYYKIHKGSLWRFRSAPGPDGLAGKYCVSEVIINENTLELQTIKASGARCNFLLP